MRVSLAAVSLLAGSALASQSCRAKGNRGNSNLPNINLLAKQAGKLWFGTAADIPGTAETTNPTYLQLLKRNFGEVTPANSLKVRLNKLSQLSRRRHNN